jgi:ribosomal protein S18 acetylase RimI-like enzyme
MKQQPGEHDYTFRKLNLPEERDKLVFIHQIYDKEYQFSRAESEYEQFVNYLADHNNIYHPLVLLDHETIVGYIRAYDRISTSSCAIVLMLDLVYILPAFRGQGMGGIIMEEFLDFASERKCARIDLLTDLDNPAAVKLYEKYGFKGRNRHQMIRFMKTHKDLENYFQRKLESDQKKS